MHIAAGCLDICKSIASSLVLSAELEIKYFYFIKIHISKVYKFYVSLKLKPFQLQRQNLTEGHTSPGTINQPFA